MAARAGLHPQQDLRHLAGPEPQSAELRLWQKYRSPANNFDAAGRPLDTLLWDTLVPNPFQGLPNVTGTIATNSTIAMNQLLNPVAILGGITENNNPWGKNQYDAMLVKVEHRFSKGFSVINSFTWSKLFEDTSWTGPEIAGRNVEHKLGGEDRPFHLSIAPIWQIPVGRGKKFGSARCRRLLDFVVGGWQLSGQFNIQSGVPVVFGTDSLLQRQGLRAAARSSRPWPSGSTRRSSSASRRRTPTSRPTRRGPESRTCPAITSSRPPATPPRTASIRTSPPTSATIPTRWGDVRASRTNNVDAVISKTFVDSREGASCSTASRPTTCSTTSASERRIPIPTSASFGKVDPTEQNNARLVQMALKLYF